MGRVVSEREKIARAIDQQVRLLRSVPADVLAVPREPEAMDLENLAADVRRGRYK